MGATLQLVQRSGGGSTNVRVPEDVLRNTNPGATAAEQTSPLISRGRLIYRGDPDNGFPGMAQHFSSTGQARTPIGYDGRTGGLLAVGRGVETSGYGSYDDGAAAFLRLARDYVDCYWTQSYRIQMRAEVPGSVGGLTFYFDTQSWDNTNRQYPLLTFASATDSRWHINNNGAFPTVPGLDGFVLGDNEDKQGSMYVAFSYYHASDITQSHYGHVQVGGLSVDCRTIGSAGKPNTPQGSPIPFGGGLNVGVGASTPTAGKWGGFCIDRMEVTVGDVLA